jgi:hypothetical protein
VLNLEKKKEKNKTRLIKINVSNVFLFCTQDTAEGVSDLGLIAVLLRKKILG